MTNLSPINSNLAKIDKQLIREMREIAHGRWSERTKEAYRSAFRDFASFCKDNDLSFLPASPESVILYLTFLARHAKWSTIKQRIAAIQAVHNVKRLPSPINDEVKEYLEGVKRKVGESVDRKAPLLVEHIHKMIALTGDDLRGLRDKLVILLGFTTLLRRSNLVDLEVSDLSFVKDGVWIRIRQEKQDQTRKGRKIFLGYGQNPETCPVTTLRKWLEDAEIREGKILRSIDKYGRIRKSLSAKYIEGFTTSYASKIGLNPEEIGAHSLRAGGATQAALNRVPAKAVQDYGGWKSANTHAIYVRMSEKINMTEHLGI